MYSGLETAHATHRMLGNRKRLMSVTCILVINGGLAKQAKSSNYSPLDAATVLSTIYPVLYVNLLAEKLTLRLCL